MNFPGTVNRLPAVLVVDDEVRSQDAIRRTLEEDFLVFQASSAAQARELLEQHEISVILCDQRMPEVTGVVFLKAVRDHWPDTVRIVISGYTDSQDIIAGINEAGIYQYILKPWSPDHLLQSVQQAVEAQQLQQQTSRLNLELRTSNTVLRGRMYMQQEQARSIFNFDRLVRAPGSPLDAVCQMAQRVARYDLSVLIMGESGTGKELLARAIHFGSPRMTGPFVVENCAAIPDTLLESEMFGHKRGAFTGAYENHLGLFQRASGGTLFLDEIGETSPAFQVKLLRVLQEGEVRPVGAARPVPVDVRIIAATNRQLEQRVYEGLFREDLYHRVSGLTLTMPPLRERTVDIAPIAQHLAKEVAAELGLPLQPLPDEVLVCLMTYAWPGNIRQLRNEMARALALSDGGQWSTSFFSSRVLQGGDLALSAPGAMARDMMGAISNTGTLSERMDVVEAMLLRETLLRHRFNKTRVAQELGLSRVGLRGKMKRLGLEGA